MTIYTYHPEFSSSDPACYGLRPVLVGEDSMTPEELLALPDVLAVHATVEEADAAAASANQDYQDAVERYAREQKDSWIDLTGGDRRSSGEARVSVTNGASLMTADDLSDEELETHWDALVVVMNDEVRERVHGSTTSKREFLRAYLAQVAHDLVIG